MPKPKKPKVFAIVAGEGVYVSDAKPIKRSQDTRTKLDRIKKRKRVEEDYRKYQKRLKFRGLAHRFLEWREFSKKSAE